MPNSVKVNRFVVLCIFALLLVLAFLIIKPFIPAILTAIVLAFIFRPLYLKINSKLNKPTIVAVFVSAVVIFLLFIIGIVLIQITIKQILEFYTFTQVADIMAPFKALIVRYTTIDPTQFSFLFDTALEKGTSFVVNSINQLIVDLPLIIIQTIITFFVMFYFIRDGDKILSYFKELLPFKETTKEQFIARFRNITSAVIYGAVVVGIIQGSVAGIGFYLFGVEGAFILSILSVFLSILPLGCWIIWIPVGINLLISGKTFAGIGLLIYGAVIVSYIDNVLRPQFVGSKAKLSPAVAILGMLGGAMLFGLVGVFIGPIILDYLLLFMEFYKRGAREIF